MSTMLPDWEIYEDLNAISRAAGDETGMGTGAGGRRNAPRNPKAAASQPVEPKSQPTTTGNSKKRANAGAADSATASPLPKQAKTAASTNNGKADAAAEEKTNGNAANGNNNIYVEGGALWYCGSHYPKGSSFSVSFGEDPTKGFPVSLVQVGPSEVQVRKNSDGSKVRIPLEDLLSGSAMILAQDSQ
jgi:hypothetical protein